MIKVLLRKSCNAPALLSVCVLHVYVYEESSPHESGLCEIWGAMAKWFSASDLCSDGRVVRM